MAVGLWLLPSAQRGGAQDLPSFQKFCGRVSLVALRPTDPNPATLLPEEENCGDGEDGDLDGQIDFADADCQGDLGPEAIFLKTPFRAIQPIGDFKAARFTGTKRNGDPFPLGELLINSTGPDGRKVSYLRTTGRDTYADVTVSALIIAGGEGDNGGPVAIRIQPADAGALAGQSYFVKVVVGRSISLHKENGDGTSVALDTESNWANGDPIEILSFDTIDRAANPCFQIVLSAVGDRITATVAEVNCHGATVDSNRFRPAAVEGHTVSLEAVDGSLLDGYVGLRSDHDAGGAVVDDLASVEADPSVLDFVVSDPNDAAVPNAPRILFLNSFSAQVDNQLDYTTRPITPRDNNTYNRSITTVCDSSLAAYLRSLGFTVDEYHIQSFEVGLLTTDYVNDTYDLVWLPSSGGGGSNRPFVGFLNVPLIFSEHVVGPTGSTQGFAGLWAGTGNLNGNENQLGCAAGTKFSAVLTGASETPEPIDTDAFGTGFFDYNAETKTLSYHIEFSGLSSPETVAHIHKGAVGETGAPVFNLPAGSPKVGEVTLSDEQAADLLAGLYYVNVHSVNHGGGEIRGQLVNATLALTHVRLLPADKGGDPNHPIVRGLADENGDIPVHNALNVSLNAAYEFPPSGPGGLSGAGFKTVARVLAERGWGLGHTETQFGGYPVTTGAKALAATVNPCTGQTFWSVDAEGNLNSADGRGHISLIAAEAGSPRLIDPSCETSPDPGRCPPTEEFEGRTVFYWLSDRAFLFSTPQTLSILRRSALWALNLLNSPNRSDIPFKRGDTNADGGVDISDPVAGLNFLFLGAAEPSCLDAGDSNDDEQLDISDAVYSLGFLFSGGPSPKAFFNRCFQGCGLDLTPEAPGPGVEELPEDILSCKGYAACR
jgi:hypothetical protein